MTDEIHITPEYLRSFVAEHVEALRRAEQALETARVRLRIAQYLTQETNHDPGK